MSSNDRRNFLKSLAAVTAAGLASGCSSHTDIPKNYLHSQSVMGLASPKIELVRIGFIGVGERGSGHVKHYCHIDGVEIKAICDTNEVVLDQTIDFVVKKNFPRPARYTGSEHA